MKTSFFILILCGNLVVFGDILKQRIYGGSNLVRGKYPWMVALKFKKGENPPTYFCGGTLIGRRRVLTGEYFCSFRNNLKMGTFYSCSLCESKV